MSEFVEESLEQLLPVYELLHTVQLLSANEVNEFIKRCRNYEYRLQKNVKDANDFVVYVEYLRGVTQLIQIRRKRLKYFYKYNQIDGAIKAKIADLYRRCTERFQGRSDIWRKRLDYLKEEKMRIRCSRAFFRAIQVLGSDVELRVEAAVWEFHSNKSIDNARLHLQLALRIFPDNHLLWNTLFRLEILYVHKLLKRRNILIGKKENKEQEKEQEPLTNGEEEQEHEATSEKPTNEEEPPSDAVLNLKLAEIVAEQALSTPEVAEKNELLYNLWRTASKCGKVAERLEKMLYDKLWDDGNICEESFMAKHNRRTEQQIDAYDVLDEAIARFETTKMFRYYIRFCENRIALDDAFAASKLNSVLKLMAEKNVIELDDYAKYLRIESDSLEKERILEKALQRFPSSSFIWSHLIRLKMADENVQKKDMIKLFNDAENAVQKADSLEIYELAIDWAIENSPNSVDAIFKRAILLSPPEVASEIKCVRLRYLKAANPDDPNVYRNEYQRMCTSPPNSIGVHKTFIELEQSSKQPDKKLIVGAMENCVAEFGCSNYECWIYYGNYLMENDPPEIAKLYARALVCVPNEQSNAFLSEWTQMQQRNNITDRQEMPIKGALKRPNTSEGERNKSKKLAKNRNRIKTIVIE